jgi:tetratricopeptide (TPR) repeat protein
MSRRKHRRPSRRTGRGFILLFGTRPIISTDTSAAPVHTVCPRCGRRSDIVGKSYRTWFTLFFIPVFPVSGARRFSECGTCGAQFEVATDALAARVAESEREQSQRAIALYNSLRASPANAVTLNELMTLYATIGEHGQAVSAANQFPDALNSSEQCMTTLGRVYLDMNRHAGAIHWFDAALVRNPLLGESQFHKAVAHLTSTPPDYAKAVAAARAARSAGVPQADELLRDVEERARGAA